MFVNLYQLKKKVGWILAVAVLLLTLAATGTALAQINNSKTAPATEKKGKVPQDGVSKTAINKDRQIKAPVVIKEKTLNAEMIKLRKEFKIIPESKLYFIPKLERLSQEQREHLDKLSFPKLPADVRVDKSNIPRGVSCLGKGFNVHTGGYADEQSLHVAYILDIDALIEDGHIGKKPAFGEYYRYMAADNVSRYMKHLANIVGLQGVYKFFKGAIPWSSSQQNEPGRTFASISDNMTLYKVFINPAVDLRYYLTESYKRDLRDAVQRNSYQSLFQKYGTHVLLSAMMGGAFEYYVTTDSRYDLTQSGAQAQVEAGFNATFANANIWIGPRGGMDRMDPAFKNSRQETSALKPPLQGKTYQQWFSGLLENVAFIDYQEYNGAGTLTFIYEVSKGATIFENGRPTFTCDNVNNYVTAYQTYASGFH